MGIQTNVKLSTNSVTANMGFGTWNLNKDYASQLGVGRAIKDSVEIEAII